MGKFLRILRMGVIDGLEYRIDVLVFVLTALVFPFVILFVWLALLASGGKGPLSAGQFIQYYLFVMIIEIWTISWSAEFRARDIREGKISSFLVKPFSFIMNDWIQNISQKLLKTIYFVPIIVFLAIILKMPIPVLSLTEWLLFFLSWVLAFAISFLMSFCIGLIAFWFDEVKSVIEFTDLFYFFLSGQLFPLVALPKLAQEISKVLPFRYMLSLPIEILQKTLTQNELVFALIMQFGWLVTFIVLYKLLWIKGVRRYSAFG